ncbi:DUF1465 family protein [Parasphingorhabdus sp.]|uniref:DUF1465 family protein n=1 Tax=Parasphingorhabdus sp. TaxID=2709688 RepID=UPI002F9457AC
MAVNEALITPRLLDALYTEAMILSDEARSYFESGRFSEQCADSAALSVAFSCESLKVTTRVMHCIAWLLNQRALHSDGLSDGQIWNISRSLGEAADSDHRIVDRFPQEARNIIYASEELFLRLQRLESRLVDQEASEPPVHGMFRRLQMTF